jgi:AcrR family transcriptional regulator
MSKEPGPVKRRYASPLRASQARATQARVVAAAARLFAERGYVATSIDAIAAAAGVSRMTVFSAVGGKPALLRRAYEVAVRGDDEETPLGQRPDARAILALRDPAALLTAYAHVCVGIGERFAGLWEAIRAAAHSDAEARALCEAIAGERRYGAGRVVAAVGALGGLRAGLDADAATDILWVLNDASLYDALVVRRSWPVERFDAWLAAAMRSQLLG